MSEPSPTGPTGTASALAEPLRSTSTRVDRMLRVVCLNLEATQYQLTGLLYSARRDGFTDAEVLELLTMLRRVAALAGAMERFFDRWRGRQNTANQEG